MHAYIFQSTTTPLEKKVEQWGVLPRVGKGGQVVANGIIVVVVVSGCPFRTVAKKAAAAWKGYFGQQIVATDRPRSRPGQSNRRPVDSESFFFRFFFPARLLHFFPDATWTVPILDRTRAEGLGQHLGRNVNA